MNPRERKLQDWRHNKSKKGWNKMTNYTREIVPNDPPTPFCNARCEWCDRNPFVAHPTRIRPLFFTTTCPSNPHTHYKYGYESNSICYSRKLYNNLDLVIEMGLI